MAHVAKDFAYLKGQLDGFSDKQLDAHLSLYAGYVAKLNEIEEKLKSADRSKANYTFNEYSELKRRECTGFNGTYLHQLYFENLSGKGGAPSDEIQKAAIAAFGSWDAYIADVRGSAGSTPGWVLTTKSRVDGLLHNYVMYEHHIGLPAHQRQKVRRKDLRPIRMRLLKHSLERLHQRLHLRVGSSQRKCDWLNQGE